MGASGALEPELGAGISSAARASGSDGHSRVSGSGGRRVRLFPLLPLLCLGNSLRLVLFQHKRDQSPRRVLMLATSTFTVRHAVWRDAASLGHTRLPTMTLTR